MDFDSLYRSYKTSLFGRYITLAHVRPLLTDDLLIIGESVLGEQIPAVKIGDGMIKILIWSQMHGNESTTTKAVMDLLSFLRSEHQDAGRFNQLFTLMIVPILNPDGAKAYTRENSNSIDLNRDFLQLTEPESKALVQLFEEFQPDYCFNMHDQRTIYGVADSGKPATVSFLAPAYNAEREWNDNRSKAANVIAAMNDVLQEIIPGQVGRFDDSFNINCAGDTFQHRGSSTILFEAGHFAGDLDREETRRLIFIALLAALTEIGNGVSVHNRLKNYLNIPQNKINFYDFVYQNVKLNYDGNKIITNFAAQIREELTDGEIRFIAEIAETSISGKVFGHHTYVANGDEFFGVRPESPLTGEPADFRIGKQEFVNGSPLKARI